MTAAVAHAEYLTEEHRETLGQALADAITLRTPPGGCPDCAEHPDWVCDDHAADLDLTDAYMALAAELGIEIEQ
jgi:hypothetical protein